MARLKRQVVCDVSRVVGYLRVSTDEQVESGLGLDAQRAAIKSEAARRGWTLLHIYEDAGVSGSVAPENRPGLSEALQEVQSGRAGTLVAAKLDRLSRSVADFAGLMEQAQYEGWNLRVLDLDIDLSTENGELIAGVMASFAQLERRLIARRTREALAARRARGMRLGRLRTVPDPLVRRIVRERAEGSSYTAIANRLNEEGVPPTRDGTRWYPSSVWGTVASLVVPDLALRIREGLRHGDLEGRLLELVVQAVTDLRALDKQQLPLHLAEPPTTKSRQWDALIAGVVEREALRAGVRVPEWTDDAERVLGRSWYPDASRAVAERTYAKEHSPAELAERRVYVDGAAIEPKAVA